jgi:3-oxoadipate enol-lactonase
MPFDNINRALLFYEDRGAGLETIFFSHGLLWSSWIWRAQLDHFSKRYRCIAADHRGQGQSELTVSGYDMDTLSEDAAALIAKLGIAPVHFVGLSMGGFVGLRLALGKPELLRSLVLVDSAADAEPKLSVPKYMAMCWAARVIGMRPFAGTVLEIMFGRKFRSDPARLAEAQAQLLANRTAGVQRATWGVCSRRAVDGLEKIRTPTLVVQGAEDTAIVAARAKRTSDAIPGARFLTIPHAGHSTPVEEPEALNAELEKFLSGLPHLLATPRSASVPMR